MEPLVAAGGVVAGHHVSVGNVLAEAVGLLHLVAHALHLIQAWAGEAAVPAGSSLVAAARATETLLTESSSIGGLISGADIELLDALGQAGGEALGSRGSVARTLWIDGASRP